MIKKEIIDEIILRNDIESLISSYISLKRAGSNLKGLCPFHSEKTPSFTVYPSDNSFYCFGCGVGGNAITFIRQMEHLDYPDAVAFLAKRANLTVLLEDEPEEDRKKTISKQKLYKMNADAAKFFHHCLVSNNPKSKAALEYFTEKRHLSMATIKHFGLGYAPDSYDSLLNYMQSLGYTKDELVIAFLAGKSERGTYYDAFRNRVMFPIIDTADNVIGFGGRVMDDSKPKYKNTMDTPVFKKSRNLFALNFARHSGTENLILCEGYMDVISLHAAGFTNAIATLGTAITAEQARVISRYTKKVIISYDADAAGQKAAQRAIKILEEVGLDVGIIKTPDAKDPDEYIKAHGKEKFADVISGSKTKFEYNMEGILSKYDLKIPQDVINAVAELEKLISTIYSRAERDVYIKHVAKKLDVSAESISRDVERLVQKNLRQKMQENNQKLIRDSVGFSDRINPDYAKAPVVAAAEESVLGLMLLYKEHRKKVFKDSLLSENDFFTEFNKRVFNYLKNSHDSFADDLGELNDAFNPEEVGRIMRMKVGRIDYDNSDKVLYECISALKSALNKKNTENISTFDELDNLLSNIRNKKDGN